VQTQGSTATYTINNLCSGIAQGTGYFDPGSIHTANMTGLTPSTRYYYIYGSDVSLSHLHSKSSPELLMMVMPDEDKPFQALCIIVVGGRKI